MNQLKNSIADYYERASFRSRLQSWQIKFFADDGKLKPINRLFLRNNLIILDLVESSPIPAALWPHPFYRFGIDPRTVW